MTRRGPAQLAQKAERRSVSIAPKFEGSGSKYAPTLLPSFHKKDTYLLRKTFFLQLRRGKDFSPPNLTINVSSDDILNFSGGQQLPGGQHPWPRFGSPWKKVPRAWLWKVSSVPEKKMKKKNLRKCLKKAFDCVL